MHDIVMHPYSPRWDLAFIALPKCASSSVRETIKHADMNAGEMSIADIIKRGPVDVFAFVRNPFRRLESCYRDKINGQRAYELGPDFRDGMSFAEFVLTAAEDPYANMHFYPQYDALNYEGNFIPTYIGHVERLQLVWLQMQIRFTGLPSIAHVNPSKGNGMHIEWSDMLVEAVHYAWQDDFLNFGYH